MTRIQSRLRDFRARVAASMRQSAWTKASQRYVPKSDIDSLTSREQLQGIIEEDETIDQKDVFLDYVYTNSRILFAMFAYYKLPISLLQSMRTDDRLPIPISDRHLIGEQEESYVDFGELINVGQWMFLAPKFSSIDSHRRLDPNEILPFRSMKQVGSGTFGTVYEVEIEPSHLNDDVNRRLALKLITRRRETDGMNERKLLEGLRDVGHPHIIKLFTSFERERDLGMLFPLATFDLDHYMHQEPPSVNDQYVSWVLKQLLGLADALSKIHEYDEDHTLSPRGSRGYHHDLKPQNILFFQDAVMPQLQGIFQISDFGLGKFRANERNATATATRTATRTDIAKWGTPMYAPPELEFEDEPSNMYDMWSLGCIILELLIWIKFGPKDRNTFAARAEKFFTKGHSGNFDVHEDVVDFIERLRRANNHIVLKEVLEVVVNGLLVWDPQGRWTSSELYQRLREIQEQQDSTSSRIDSPWYPENLANFRWHNYNCDDHSEYDPNVVLEMQARRPFMLGPRLGESRAVVYKVFCKRRIFALKLVESTIGGATTTAAANEIGILSRLDHGHIIQFVGSYRRPLDKQRLEIGMILYPAAQCNLQQFLGAVADRGSEDEKDVLRNFLGCLSRIVRMLHKERVKHKDIKPQNILVNEKVVFFSDFGISRHFGDGTSVTNGPSRHTRRYSAPEVANADKRGRAADIFSLGCVFLEIISVISGRQTRELLVYLNEDENKSTYFENLTRVDSWIREKLAGELSPPDSGILSLILRMLVYKPENRPDAEEVVRDVEATFKHSCRICGC